MLFYCGINERTWNGSPVTPGPYSVVSPVYGSKESKRRINNVYVPKNTKVIQDSGAFCDGPGSRLSFAEAYHRQVEHARQFEYEECITHRASYDLLIDEKWKDGQRSKQRWGEEEAWVAVRETIQAARYLSGIKDGKGKVLSAQGVEPYQYLACVKEVIPLLSDGDILGLGGWCITGKLPKQMMPVFRKTMALVIPYARKQGVKRVHIWGVIYAPATGELQYICDKHRVKASTDSAGPSMNPAAYSRWGFGDWIDPHYRRPDNPKERGPDRIRHVALTREWLNNIHKTKYYRQGDKGEQNANHTGHALPGSNHYRQLSYDSLWSECGDSQRFLVHRVRPDHQGQVA